MVSTPSEDLQKKLLKFLDRRHPRYEELIDHWNFLQQTYEGGREWFEDNIFRYIKEGDTEYADRVERCYRFNHTREVVDLVQKYIFKTKIQRNEKDAPDEIKEFWKNATLSGLDINQFMKMASTTSSILGMPWIFVDSTATDQMVSIADAREANARCYAYIVPPQDILDVGYDEHGETKWVLVREIVRDDNDPIESTGEIKEQFRLWERDNWRLFEIEEVKDGSGEYKRVVNIIDTDVNPLGVIPGFPLRNTIGDDPYSSPALINDIAYLDRAIANYLSNLDAIIQDQTFSQLAMPAQALLPGEEAYNKLVEMGTKRVFVYDGESGSKPDYLSPDPKQAGVIITVINKIINEIYHSIGMAGERTKQDNAVGIDNSSGVAKAYDFERLNSLLSSKADTLENAENKIIDLVMRWHKKAAPAEELVKYPDTFDVRGMFDEITLAEKLAMIDAPHAVRREQMRAVVEKIFPRLADDLKKELHADIDKWPPDVNLPVGERPAPKPAEGRNPQTQNRQGQVTSDE